MRSAVVTRTTSSTVPARGVLGERGLPAASVETATDPQPGREEGEHAAVRPDAYPATSASSTTILSVGSATEV